MEQLVSSSGLFSSSVPMVFVLLGAALLPFVLLATTSYLKLSVVFAILRNALGGGQFPPAGVTSLLALVLSAYIMAPIGRQVLQVFGGVGIAGGSGSTPDRGQSGTLTATQGVEQSAIKQYLAKFTAAIDPLEDFLRRHSNPRERLFFVTNAKEKNGGQTQELNRVEFLGRDGLDDRGYSDDREDREMLALPVDRNIEGEGIFTLLPSFMLSELKEAFGIGFALFLPFLVIDLVVTNLLVGLGMMMVSPTTISTPLKLILFVLCDGWFLLSKGLILGYQ